MTFVRFTNEEIDEMRRTNRPYPASGVFLEEANSFLDGYGQFVGNLHPASACADREFCVIHRQSDHNMRAFPLRWRTAMFYDIKPSHFERMCPHGTGHPDPDDMGYWISIGEESMGVHGCDGCCGKSADENWEKVVLPEKADPLSDPASGQGANSEPGLSGVEFPLLSIDAVTGVVSRVDEPEELALRERFMRMRTLGEGVTEWDVYRELRDSGWPDAPTGTAG